MGELILKDLTKQYGDNVVVNKVSLVVNEGELLTVVGPSGCGKTTILRMIAGLTDPTGGSIAIDGKLLADPDHGTKPVEPEERGFGMVFQSYAVWPHMNVFDNVAYPLKIRKMDARTIEREVTDALKLVHLSGYEKRMSHELSGGQQQRVALARALVMRPRLLLLDEPLSNLDAALREEMRGEIKEIQRKLGITVINVTHDQIEAMTMSDKVAVMCKGVLVQYATPRELYEAPINTFVAKFIGSANIIPAHKAADARPDANGMMEVNVDGKYRCRVPYVESCNTGGFLAVRSHHLHRSADGSGISAVVQRSLYQGEQIEYHLEVAAGHPVRMLAPADSAYQIGDRFPLTIEKAVWLDE